MFVLSVNQFSNTVERVKMSEILFEHDELLADPANPECAWCSSCNTLQPIENFRRRASLLQAERWGWNELRDKKHAVYTGKDCNECAAERKRTSNYFDYVAYEKELQLTGRYEYEVPDPRYPLYHNKYIPKRQAMVLEMRAKRGEGKVRGGIKGYRKRQQPVYAAHLKAIRVERQRVYAWGRQMKGLSDAALAFAKNYDAYLITLAQRVKDEQQCKLVQPKPYVEGYMMPNAPIEKELAVKFRALYAVERDRLKPRYVV